MEALRENLELDLGCDRTLPAAQVAEVRKEKSRIRARRRLNWTALAARSRKGPPVYLSDSELYGFDVDERCDPQTGWVED